MSWSIQTYDSIAGMISTQSSSSGSLNPGAPEFFPSYYLNPHMYGNNAIDNYHYHHLQFLSNTSEYFSSSIPINPLFSNYHHQYCTSVFPPPPPPHPLNYPFLIGSARCHATTTTSSINNLDLSLVPASVTNSSSIFGVVPHQQPKVDTNMDIPRDVITQEVVTGTESTAKKGGRIYKGRGSRGNKKHANKEYCGSSKFSGGGSSTITNQQEMRRQCSYTSSSRRSYVMKSCVNSKQKHQVEPVVPDGQDTTVMIRNIPNRFTRQMLMDFLDRHCMVQNQEAKVFQNSADSSKAQAAVVSAFDFLYLPIDFERKANKGYAFVNFTDARAAWKFCQATNDQAWDVFHSNKIREVARARLQGMEELVRHFEKSTFECDTDEYLPVYFSPARDGSRETVQQRVVGRRAYR